MCVANLNVAMQPCSHRWYTLVRSCTPTTNLSNCTEKLRLEGWETRNAECPWCSSNSSLDDSTHRLLSGSGRSASRPRADSYNATAAAVASSSSMSPARYRRTSSATNSSSSLSRSSSRSGDDDFDVDTDPGAMARLMNDRINYYMFRNPERDDWIKKDEEIAAAPADHQQHNRQSSEPAGVSRRGSKVLGKTWRKSVRLGRGMFKA